METAIVESQGGITLIGGGPVSRPTLDLALRHAPHLVAADGGADQALRLGRTPAAVFGDMDSLSDAARLQLGDRIRPITEQEHTDFDKALRHIQAPYVLGVGFTGGRLDHSLAVLNGLTRHPDRRCLLVSGSEVIFLAPPHMTLRLVVGSRLSLFPLGEVEGQSHGLHWPIGGLKFAPDGQIGTSNRVSEPEVSLRFSQPKMLVILPRRALPAVLAAL